MPQSKLDKLALSIENELIFAGRKWTFSDGPAFPSAADIKAVLTKMKESLAEREGDAIIEMGGIIMIRRPKNYEVYFQIGELKN